MPKSERDLNHGPELSSVGPEAYADGTPESSAEKTDYLKNKLDGIIKAATIKAEIIKPPEVRRTDRDMQKGEDYEFIRARIDAISGLADLSSSITLDQAYEQLKGIYESLEGRKTDSNKETQEVIDFFQGQIMLYFGDLNERKISKGKTIVEL